MKRLIQQIRYKLAYLKWLLSPLYWPSDLGDTEGEERLRLRKIKIAEYEAREPKPEQFGV